MDFSVSTSTVQLYQEYCFNSFKLLNVFMHPHEKVHATEEYVYTLPKVEESGKMQAGISNSVSKYILYLPSERERESIRYNQFLPKDYSCTMFEGFWKQLLAHSIQSS